MPKVFLNQSEFPSGAIRFIDTRFSLSNPGLGRTLYEKGHLPGAIFLDLEKNASDMSSSLGRHPFPSKEGFQHFLESNGLSYEDTIVIYDQGASPFATRAYFLFRWAGFSNVFVSLDGYEELTLKWGVDSLPVDYPVTILSLHWHDNLIATKDEIKHRFEKNEAIVLVDARSAHRFSGKQEPFDAIAGRIPSACNVDWEQFADGNHFRLDQEIGFLQDRDKSEELVVYCGSGVTASVLFCLFTHWGFSHTRIYVGSYSDWITSEEVETDN
ncbi:sulfurtransferase [Paenisporosarcina cavernae]|nr:rhodanese-like domain-containing protein [Paenisporosarcina cavernae]